MMRTLIIFLLPILLLCGCEHSFYEKEKEEDIKKNRLFFEYEQLIMYGIEGIGRDKNNTIIFYVADPNEQTRKQIEKGLIKIFGQKIDFILEDSDQFHVKWE
ncbi:hypothetical protein H1D32_02250 [Anaerobacillus sp. CMMVII]|uniref:hypothetical protein n=1 Tax=Anaerobacillus sp. CMMVII TaxID=2755588 RepID=UPI0021B6E7BA|nr:hypothetical protein [Anaerobacillus sp. CMMVII]MCT8136671.1 hypothetical protein [Anaerobacillus sp. CMMVII]